MKVWGLSQLVSGTNIHSRPWLTRVRRLLLRREGEILIAVLKPGVSRRYSS
jgi:hypothetical protein